MIRRFKIWFFFSFLVSLTPFAISFVIAQTLDRGFDWTRVLRDGELLIITFALAATGIGDIFAHVPVIAASRGRRRRRSDSRALYCLFFLMTVIFFSGVSYAASETAMLNSIHRDETFVMIDAVVLFVCTSICAAICAAWNET